MSFLISCKDGENYILSGDAPESLHRKINRQEAREYLIAVGCPLEEIESVLDKERIFSNTCESL